MLFSVDPDDEEDIVFEDESEYKYNDGSVFEDIQGDDIVFDEEDEEDF